MRLRPPERALGIGEFVSLLALMLSTVALSIDAMLPALGHIARDLALDDPNDAQFVVTTLFLGFALGQVMAGPLSDSLGRKPVICAGYGIFLAGCMLSMLASSYSIMLTGRFLQGLGAAAPRIISIALVRDGYQGRAMARIMSIVMALFIFVPTIAPAIGQVVMLFLHWRAIFGLLLGVALVALLWFASRQPETLAPQSRRSISLHSLALGIREAFAYRMMTGYTLAMGMIFGAFLGYLSSAQQIFQTAYDVGQWFAVYFGVAALSVGAASLFNARVVMRLGMRYLAWRALIGLCAVSVVFAGVAVLHAGLPPLWSFLLWLVLGFFCVGILFGNLNALAMEPLGHMAGLGAALVGSVSTLVALPLGATVGGAFDGTVVPLVLGFAAAGGAATLIVRWTESKPADGAQVPQNVCRTSSSGDGGKQ